MQASSGYIDTVLKAEPLANILEHYCENSENNPSLKKVLSRGISIEFGMKMVVNRAASILLFKNQHLASPW